MKEDSRINYLCGVYLRTNFDRFMLEAGESFWDDTWEGDKDTYIDHVHSLFIHKLVENCGVDKPQAKRVVDEVFDLYWYKKFKNL